MLKVEWLFLVMLELGTIFMGYSIDSSFGEKVSLSSPDCIQTCDLPALTS